MMRHQFTMLAVMFWTGCASGTVQERDLLVLEGERIYTYDLPRPEQAFPNIKFPEFEMISTGNYKGYRATWATFGKKLYLIGLEARVHGKEELQRNEQLTPNHTFPLKVSGWSGEITRTERSSVTEGIDGPTYQVEKTTTIVVQDGAVTSIHVTTNRRPV